MRHPTMMTPARKWELPVTLACVLLGFLTATMFKVQRREGFPVYRQPDQMARLDKDMEASREAQMRMIKYLEVERNKLTEDLSQTRDRLAKLEAPKSGDTGASLRDDLEKARILAGLVPVKGPGVQVTLNDSPRKPGPNDDIYNFLIHDTNIEAFVNELWAAGAEAVAVNDQRIATSSSIRCVGPTVLVNSTRVAPPFVIRAIGDPKTLEAALQMPGGVLYNMEPQLGSGVLVKIQRSTQIVLPEFKGAASFRYLHAAQEAP
ncbi:MAG: DUF881 domain-containing protein [Candidatus Xenobia bacterium]